jgi:hypothetical protein
MTLKMMQTYILYIRLYIKRLEYLSIEDDFASLVVI